MLNSDDAPTTAPVHVIVICQFMSGCIDSRFGRDSQQLAIWAEFGMAPTGKGSPSRKPSRLSMLFAGQCIHSWFGR